jgi:hypothetical protein
VRSPALLLAIAACGPVAQAPAPPQARPQPVAMPASPTTPEAAWPLLARARDLDGAPVGDAPVTTAVVVFASWCGNCHVELLVLGELLAARDDLRVLGVNFVHHEEYDERGDAAAVRAYVAAEAPWMRVVPGDEALFVALGEPPKIPALYVYAPDGRLRARYDRRWSHMPDAAELAALLDRI